MLWDVQIYGTAISKTLWDPTAVNGLGDVTMTRVDPFCFYPDPDARDISSMNYCFEVQRLSVAELDRRFPGAGAIIAAGDGGEQYPDEPPSQLNTGRTAGGLEALGRSGNDSSGSATSPRWSVTSERGARQFRSATDHVLVKFAWLNETADAEPEPLELVAVDPTAAADDHDRDDEPNMMTRPEQARTENWRCGVYCGAHVLLDEFAEDLWSHGRHPYDRFVEQDMGEFWGRSMVDQLAAMQVSVNRLLAAIEHNIWLMGNPVMVEEKRSGIPRARRSRTARASGSRSTRAPR